MRNKFKGTCYRCGKPVEAGAGHFERFGSAERKLHPNAPFTVKWLTQHADCAIEHRGTSKSIYATA